jgi:hypothetical protein
MAGSRTDVSFGQHEVERNWDILLPRFVEVLVPNGISALVEMEAPDAVRARCFVRPQSWKPVCALQRLRRKVA